MTVLYLGIQVENIQYKMHTLSRHFWTLPPAPKSMRDIYCHLSHVLAVWKGILLPVTSTETLDLEREDMKYSTISAKVCVTPHVYFNASQHPPSSIKQQQCQHALYQLRFLSILLQTMNFREVNAISVSEVGKWSKCHFHCPRHTRASVHNVNNCSSARQIIKFRLGATRRTASNSYRPGQTIHNSTLPAKKHPRPMPSFLGSCPKIRLPVPYGLCAECTEIGFKQGREVP